MLPGLPSGGRRGRGEAAGDTRGWGEGAQEGGGEGGKEGEEEEGGKEERSASSRSLSIPEPPYLLEGSSQVGEERCEITTFF